MLPTVVAQELREAVSQFLRSAFPVATPFFQRSEVSDSDPNALIDDLLARPGALFKGPYLDIKLPFKLAETDSLPFKHLRLPFRPYHHQMTAFQRLSGDAPQSTIVATGTGSGKTECFMLPVLDDCLNRREQGVKTIVIYPMNALATDQARRFADEVNKLDTRLTVGLFVGGEQKGAHEVMDPENVITSHKTLRQNPPDILLTNYKMLDFLLIRPKDQPLWRHNKPGTLRYLVVDELHSFDGAQGTDLACLIRRLRDRLDAGPELACVGTSATMGSDSVTELLDYASQVFATEFAASSIIGESRLSPNEYLLGDTEDERTRRREAIRFFHWPDRDERRLDPWQYDRFEDYLFHQARLWFNDLSTAELPQLNAADPFKRATAAVQLGELLHQHQVFHELVRATASLVDLQALAADWQQQLHLPSLDQAQLLLTSLTSLVAAARLWKSKDSPDPEKWCQPFLQVRQQLWLRELRRLVCSVPTGDDIPAIHFADDLRNPEKPLHLPLLHCRECHLAAWGGVIKKGDSHLHGDLQSFYQAWFGYSPQARLLIPRMAAEQPEGVMQRFCPQCLRLQALGAETSCTECQAEPLLDVWVPDMTKKSSRGELERLQCHHDCPECGARESLAIMGYRAATLTSVMTGRLFSTPYNDDYKLIAFSDSVQDAAHRAGFLGANTWRQVMRQAMAGWLRQQPAGLSLREMADLLPAFWRDKASNDNQFCGVFIAPNMAWLRDYQTLTAKGQLPPGSDLPNLVSKRLAWECIAEFGRRSTRGRSLERTGMAAVGLDEPRLAADVQKLAEILKEEVESLRDLDDSEFMAFVLGWLHHARQIGAIYDPVLDGYLGNKGKEYLLNRLHWMPGFARAQRPPAAVTLRHVSNNFEALVQSNRDTWSARWLKKTLARDAVFAAAETKQIFNLTLQCLTRAGWLVEREAAGEALWLLNPDRLMIDSRVRALACNRCRHGVNSSTELLAHFEGMPCSRGACRGHLQLAQDPLPTRDYGITAPRRLVPSEHTGLLPREAREEVERSFIHGHEPWDVNLLSATPTLEMGIDIGDLSSVFLCSVPPAQANYLQRIGRAGRRDGNALAVTVANGQNHDLFFYANPTEMIAGSVHTPGVFLNAIAVLERQLTAYCFDRWAASGIDASVIPGELRKVIDAVEHKHLDQFPYNLISFVDKSRVALLSGFFNMFDHLDNEAKTFLEDFLYDRGETTLSHRLITRLQQLVSERESLLRKAKLLKLEVDKLKKQPEDEATKELIDAIEQEKNALTSLLYTLSKQLVLNFLTDEGLLPNYAFPEEGVTLRSVILRRRSKESRQEGDSAFEKTSYAFQRPAQAALSELAPQNRFYAVSHEMEIDQVDLQVSECEAWRFCSRCQHTERVDIADKHSACPCCGSPQWADSGQKHQVLKLRQVYSTVDDRYSRIGDDSEQREPQFFNRQMLVSVPPQANQGGFRIKSESLPFGFEFLRRANFREVNFGPMGGDTHSFSVAGRELSRVGFKICRHCGKVQKERWRKNEKPHAFTCKLYKNPETETPEDYFESLYLYREIASEAIRILLPLSEVAYSDEKLHSFIAALNLGLRAYFQGDVHHLEVTDMHEPATEQSGERIFLVVYDRIPGGTGYLKDLMRAPEKLFSVLEVAWQRLTSCDCIDSEHLDGCYRCILAYRNSRNMATISRRAAADLLADILELKDQLEPVASLSDISTNILIESKLEQKFVDALAMLPGAQMSKALVNGKTGSLLTLPGADGRAVPWLVEHQVKLGPSDGVAIQTAVDVMLIPARAEDAARYRPIAVYVDGLQYHHDIVADDVAKRSALLMSGRYWVYSLNWDDIPEPGKPAAPHVWDIMRADGLAQSEMVKLFDGAVAHADWLPAAEHGATHTRGSLEWLSALLRDPAAGQNHCFQRAGFRGFTALAPKAAKDPTLRQKIVYELAEHAPSAVQELLDLELPDRIPGGFMEAFGNLRGGVGMTLSMPMASLSSGKLDEAVRALKLHLCFDDRNTESTQEFKDSWRAFWHAANQLQFLPGFSMATRTGVTSGQLDNLWSAWRALAPTAEQTSTDHADTDGQWADVFELSLLDRGDLLELSALAIPEPEVGIDLANDDGEVLVGGDFVELCWREQKVAVVNADIEVTMAGWRFIPDDSALVPEINKLIEQGVF